MLKNLLLLTFSIFVSACAVNPDNAEPKKVDPRQGEAVNQVCFNRSMDSWSTIKGDNKALVVYDRHKKQYKLDLIGTCDPQFAMLRIATVSRTGSSCLSKGDKVITDADTDIHDSCTIMGIYKWHPEKAENTQKNEEIKTTPTNVNRSESK